MPAKSPWPARSEIGTASIWCVLLRILLMAGVAVILVLGYVFPAHLSACRAIYDYEHTLRPAQPLSRDRCG